MHKLHAATMWLLAMSVLAGACGQGQESAFGSATPDSGKSPPSASRSATPDSGKSPQSEACAEASPVTDLAWSPDGSALAVATRHTNATAGDYLTFSVVEWPGLTVRPTVKLDFDFSLPVGLSDDGQIYWYGAHNGSNGVWRLSPEGQISLVGSAPSPNHSAIVATSSDVIWADSPDGQTGAIGLYQMDWNGAITQLASLPGADRVWIDATGQWVVLMEWSESLDRTDFTVHHGASTVTLSVPVDAALLGMTPDHSALVYRTADNRLDLHASAIELVLLDIETSEEHLVRVPLPSAQGAAPAALSPLGVVAYTDIGVFGRRVCFAGPVVGESV